MKLLVLSSLVKNDDTRDKLTYNFITREMIGLSERGHEVFFFVRHQETVEPIEGVRLVRPPDRQTVILKVCKMLMRFPLRFLYPLMLDFHRTLQVLKTEASLDYFLEKQPIDVIHSHFLSPSGESAVLAAHKHGVPVVATLRGAELRNMPELDYGSMRNPAYRYLFSWAKSMISHTTAPNRSLTSELISTYGVAPDRVSFVPNGVALECFSKENSTHSPSRELRLIAVGWFTELKNHMVILEALAALGSQSIYLTLVGEGYLSKEYRTFIEQAGLEEYVSIQGTVERGALLRLLATSDCLVHPSLIEGMPNVVLEALYLGLPCIVSEIPGHREVITDHYNGYFFPTKDSTRLALLLSTIQGQRFRLDRMKPNCFRSGHLFSLDRKLSSYEEIYKAAQLNQKPQDN